MFAEQSVCVNFVDRLSHRHTQIEHGWDAYIYTLLDTQVTGSKRSFARQNRNRMKQRIILSEHGSALTLLTGFGLHLALKRIRATPACP